MRTACLVGLLCMFLPLNANSQELPDVNWLISEVVKNAVRNDEIKKQHLQFTKEEVVRDLSKIGTDGKGKIEKNKTDRRGVKLANDEPKLNPQDISTLYHEFKYSVPYYQIDNQGRKYYQVSFKPKRADQNGINEYVKGANRCSGTIFIDADNLYVIRLKGEMPESEGFSTWGLLKIKWFKVDIRQNRRADLNNLVVIDSVVIQLKYRIQTIILGARHYFEQYEYRYSNYVYIP